jgi:putative hemolysin
MALFVSQAVFLKQAVVTGFGGTIRALPLKMPRAVRDHGTLDPSLGRMGTLEVRLAITKKDIRRAQKLRYNVFFGEGGAIADARSALARRDICPFDRICDHMLVIDHAAKNRFGRIKPKVVGTYRLLRKDIADKNGGFYSAQEFDIAPLLAKHGDKNFLELGRSCVLLAYRSKRTIELLWRGIAAYVQHYRIDAMIGCASFEGANPLKHALGLSFLHHHALAQGEWAARALPEQSVGMDMISAETIDLRRALDALPTLVRGYLRLGATFGEGAVVDRQFGTVDVLVIMPVSKIDAKYLDHFSPEKRAA